MREKLNGQIIGLHLVVCLSSTNLSKLCALNFRLLKSLHDILCIITKLMVVNLVCNQDNSGYISHIKQPIIFNSISKRYIMGSRVSCMCIVHVLYLLLRQLIHFWPKLTSTVHILTRKYVPTSRGVTTYMHGVQYILNLLDLFHTNTSLYLQVLTICITVKACRTS